MSPQVFIIDSFREPTRSWSDYSPAPKPATYDPERACILHEGQPVKSGIVLIHRSFFFETNDLEVLEPLVRDNQSLILIVISGSSTDARPASSGRLYYRRTYVDRGYDPSFAACWKAFCNRVYEGGIDFSLLEPRWSPTLAAVEFLCEGYRLAHADPALLPESPPIVRRVSVSWEKRSLTESVDWWLRGLAASSLDTLLERIKREVPRREVRVALEAVFHGPAVQPDAVRVLHDEVVRLRTAIP